MVGEAGRRIVRSDYAPAALGPYSQAVEAGGFLFCSGQVGLDPVTGELVSADVTEQAEQCLRNLEAVCAAAGVSLQRAARVTVYLKRIEDFPTVNSTYERHFDERPPARVTVGVDALPAGADVELDAIVPLDTER